MGPLRILTQATYQSHEFLKPSKSKQTIFFAMGRGFDDFSSLLKAMGRGFMICGFIVNATGRCFEKKPLGLDLRPLKACYGHDRV